jgi:hypothetical protein
MANQRFGGSFAPPLTDELLAEYKAAVDALPASALKDGLLILYNCCQKWWEQPESTEGTTLHPSGAGTIVSLDPAIAKALWDHIPWKEELATIQVLCDAIPASQQKLRHCAFHLLWHAKELEMDREPMTSDKVNL